MRPTMNQTPVSVKLDDDGRYVVHAVTEDGVVDLGRHSHIADVWRALDTIDSPVPFAQAA